LPATQTATAASHANRIVFIIALENHDWSAVRDSPSAPYINRQLLPVAAYAEQYYNPPRLHPSEPNYLWLEAGTNFGIIDDADPAINHVQTSDHLVTLLDRAEISWKTYQEGISGKVCPLVSTGSYAAKHNPMIFFDDVTNNRDSNSAYCIQHMRPYTELAADLTNNTVASYNFITPNECNDMHDSAECATHDPVWNGDTWLSKELPKILASNAYQDGGVLFIVWDEGGSGDGPIGLIAVSPNVKPGYSNTIHYTHSSLLRTVQEIFGVTPLLGDAENATDLSDLFAAFP
jgi:phospholipase C